MMSKGARHHSRSNVLFPVIPAICEPRSILPDGSGNYVIPAVEVTARNAEGGGGPCRNQTGLRSTLGGQEAGTGRVVAQVMSQWARNVPARGTCNEVAADDLDAGDIEMRTIKIRVSNESNRSGLNQVRSGCGRPSVAGRSGPGRVTETRHSCCPGRRKWSNRSARAEYRVWSAREVELYCNEAAATTEPCSARSILG